MGEYEIMNCQTFFSSCVASLNPNFYVYMYSPILNLSISNMILLLLLLLFELLLES